MDCSWIENQIEDIDKEFRDQGVPPFKRPIAAVVEIARRNNISLPIVINNNAGSNVPYPKENELITNKIYEWYKKHYGDALKVNFSPGTSIVEILGNPYELRIPKAWGSVSIFWDSNFDDSRNPVMSRGPAKLNVAKQIHMLTTDLAKRVNLEEQRRILQWFILCFETFNSLHDRLDNWSYRDQIITNLDSSFRYLICHTPNYGESMWASLQATEKAIKSVLLLEDQDPKWTHELESLATRIKYHSKLQLDLLKAIQCKAGVRYGEETVDLKRAKRAHYAAIEFIHNLIEITT